MSVSDFLRIPIAVTCTGDLPFDFHFLSMSGREELGRMFQYEVRLSSPVPDIGLQKILGQSLTVIVPLSQTRFRHFNGIVVRFTEAGREGRMFQYTATICPKLWLLTRNRDSRVFQGATVPEVVRWILKDNNIPASDELLVGTYRQREYLTQYRETTFDFISRLLEQEGIYYFFRHEEGLHTMVLADSVSAHETRPGYESLPLNTPDWPTDPGRSDFLGDWNGAWQIQTNWVTVDDYDFRFRKGASISSSSADTPEHPHGVLANFDFPGGYLLAEDSRDGDIGKTQESAAFYAGVQLEEERAELERFEASGNVRGLETGALFGISNIVFFEGAGFLVVATDIHLTAPALETGDLADGDNFNVRTVAMFKDRPFRPARLTRKPVVPGPQSARVVGDPGIGPDEQIWTDEYGRIKVEFFWDWQGREKAQSAGSGDAPGFLGQAVSCWVRVATPWAGSNWGAIHIPRIGQEVLVQFIEGDPDRPVVVGSLYNADQMPPYKLPENKTQSGIKSRSTPRGTPSNFNEIRFEDKKGSEELFIQAEKNQTVNVKASRSLSVGGSESISVGGSRTTTVTKNDTVKINGEHNLKVTKQASQYFQNGLIHNVYGADEEILVEKGKTEIVQQIYSLKSDTKIEIEVGGSKLTITPSGIEIKAETITVNGSTMVDIKGGIIKLNS